MKRTLLFLPAALIFLFGIAFSGGKLAPRPENQPVFIGNESISDIPYFPSQPGMTTDSPGIIVGGTQYDYQSNGSTGRRIALDSQGGIHVDWMNGVTYPSVRHVYYNYKDNAGTWLVPGIGSSVSQQTGAGYTQLELTNDDRAIAAYHQWQTSPYSVVAIDAFSGFGIFNYYDPPDFVQGVRCYWPYVAVDRSDRIHLVVNEQAVNAGDPSIMAYTRSTDDGDTWSTLEVVDTLMTLSPVVVASPVSDKVAIAYTHPLSYDTQWENDIYYIESADGVTWNWASDRVNVTNYGAPDSVFAYIDIDAIYDYNDNLNIIWNVNMFSGDTSRYFECFLYHYNTSTGVITEVASSPEDWPLSGCDTGVWNLNIAKMSLGIQQSSGDLFAVYTGFFDNTDCSATGFANGDIYMQYSMNGGASWTSPQNLTESHTPGCTPGNCDSDHWASLADNVDGALHITYINDKDAGGIAQTEGVVTDNPVMYLEVAVTGIETRDGIPRKFELAQNYPNPFNARTIIGYELTESADVDLSIYDITGAKVATLVSGAGDAGKYSAEFDASDYSSGVYYYRLVVNGVSATNKMTLIK